MKKIHKLFWISFCSMSICASSNAAETGDKKPASAKELWKIVIVDGSRSHNRLFAAAQDIINKNAGTPEALTAELLIGRIEMDRALGEAQGATDKARAIFENLAKNQAAAWQGQAAKLALISLLHAEGKHAELVTASLKELQDINWDLLGKDAPPDLADYKKMANADSELSPDILRMFLSTSYFALGKKEEANQWAAKIQNAEMKKETEEAFQPR